MSKKILNWIRLFPGCSVVIVILFGIGMIALCVGFTQLMAPDAMRNYETENNIVSQYYGFDPTTIFKELDRENTNIFSLLPMTPEVPNPLSNSTLLWHQIDYVRVAQALFKQLWNESIESQNLYAISFTAYCAEIQPIAFSEAKLYFFTTMQKGNEVTRAEIHTFIYPSDQLVHMWSGEYTPDKKKYVPLDLSHYRLTADDVFQIAELHGGKDKRLAYGNDCRIYVDTPSSGGQGWEVTYEDRSFELWKTIFKVIIDPQNGEYVVSE